MLTTTAAVTAAIAAILNAVVLLGWWDLTPDQMAGINLAVVAVGAVVHTLLNPQVPIGVTGPSE
jgi:hypothetical protein